MDENKSTSKRGNSLNEDERKIANMDESDFFFLLMALPRKQRIDNLYMRRQDSFPGGFFS